MLHVSWEKKDHMTNHVISWSLFEKMCKQYFPKNRSLDFLNKTKVGNLVQDFELLNFQNVGMRF